MKIFFLTICFLYILCFAKMFSGLRSVEYKQGLQDTSKVLVRGMNGNH